MLQKKRRVSKKRKDKANALSFLFCGDPYGNRTHDSALRGPRLNRLTNGPSNAFSSIARRFEKNNSFLKKIVKCGEK